MSTVRITEALYDMADFGPSCPLPDMGNVSYVHSQVTWEDSLTQEDVRYMTCGRVGSILPYLDQNGYTRRRKQQMKPTVVLENERVRAVFLPFMGGRLRSLQIDGREMLSLNPVIQPGNLALRNAWCSGGVEWNVSIRGHSPLTCEPVFAETLNLPDGTAGIRLYEYERIRGIVYRIEAYLPPQSPVLYVQNTIENPPGNGETYMYWWSNIAVPEDPDMRVIAPAESAVLSLYDAGNYRMLRHPLPVYENWDLSVPCAIPRSLDVFYDIPDSRRKYITAIGSDHRGLVHCSTEQMFGRKLFVWGMGTGGRRWQDWLSDGNTRYVEIQAGLARTQQEHLPMAEGAVWSWLEAYGSLSADLTDLSYAESVCACDEALDQLLPEAMLCEEASGRAQLISRTGGTIALYGSGWGALEAHRRARQGLSPLSSICRFPAKTLGEKQAPFVSLLDTGAFPDDLDCFPAAYLVSDAWRALLEAAPVHAGTAYHLGIIAHAAGNLTDAVTQLQKSLTLRENAPAHRALARIALISGNRDDCLFHYREALRLLQGEAALRLEYASVLMTLHEPERLTAYLHTLSPEEQVLPRYRFLEAWCLAQQQHFKEAASILNAPLEIPDMREGELSLSDLYFDVMAGLNGISGDEARKTIVLPYALDFRMH